MSISTFSNRWLNRLYKSIAVLLVMFAVLISALRLFLPYAENYRQDLESYINNTYQSKVVIGELSMGWHNLGPTLVANNVTLLNNDAVKFTIEKIDVQLDFWQSLRRQKFITSNFILDGSRVIIDRALLAKRFAKSPASAKLNATTSTKKSSAPVLEGLADLFFDQISRFSLRNSQLVIKHKGKRKKFSVGRLSWFNIGQRHIAKADVIVDGLTTNKIKLMLDVRGTNSRNVSGQLYLHAKNLNITPWLDKIFVIENEKTDSNINFSAWLSIEKGAAKQLQLAFDKNEVSWQVLGAQENSKQKFSLQRGQVLISHLDKSSQLSIETTPLSFSLNGQSWQPLTFKYTQAKDDYFAYLSHGNLGGVARLIPLFSQDENIRYILENLNITGSVDDVFWQKSAKGDQVVANFSNVTSHFVNDIPGISNASGNFIFTDEAMQINLLAKQGELDFGHHFIKPIHYHTLKTKIKVNKQEQGWKIRSDELYLQSDEITFAADVAVEIPNEGEASMSLVASITDAYVEKAHHFFPLTTMSKSLVSYLEQGLVSGDIEQAVVLFNGPFARFPFEDKSGIFTVDAELKNTVFNFADDWPNITKFDANLNFTNNSMMIKARAGDLVGLDITGVEVGIAELQGEGLLTVDLDLIDVNPDHVRDLMNKSPLKNTVGASLNQLVISKAIAGNFRLDLPLNDPEKAVSKGVINFHDNHIALQAPQMDFAQLNGQLTFTNDVLKADNLTLLWQGLPLSIQVSSANKENYYRTKIDLNANWQAPIWQKHVPKPLLKYVQGAFQWQGELLLNNHHDGGFSYRAKIDSSLSALQLDIPAPYQKDTEQEQTFLVDISGRSEQSTITVDLGEQLSFYGMLNHAKAINNEPSSVYFSRAHLVLGHEKMLLPMDGFHITTGLARADLFAWQSFIKDILDSVDSVDSVDSIDTPNTKNESAGQLAITRPLIAKPERIRGTIDKLDVFGQPLNNVSFNVVDKQNWWLLQLNAKEARAEIKFYPDWLMQGIDVRADFLHLSGPPEKSDEKSPSLEAVAVNTDAEFFATFPSITLDCDSCRYDKVDFGHLSFEVKRMKNQIKLVNFKANRDKTALVMEGNWQFDDVGSVTVLSGKHRINDIEFELGKLGFESTMKDSGGNFDFAFNWQGGPQGFSLGKLNGAFHAALDDGYLAEVSEKGAKVFSMLSLGSLARKLKLDFRDIFSDGMFYSNITGDFIIKSGVLYTDNTQMNGAAGDVTIKGNTNLASGLIDYRMSYKPNLTSSLPVLAWIATLNPVVFLTGLAINEVITATVISEFNFELTGDVNNPILKEVSRKSKNISVGQSSPVIIENPPKEIKGNIDG